MPLRGSVAARDRESEEERGRGAAPLEALREESDDLGHRRERAGDAERRGAEEMVERAAQDLDPEVAAVEPDLGPERDGLLMPERRAGVERRMGAAAGVARARAVLLGADGEVEVRQEPALGEGREGVGQRQGRDPGLPPPAPGHEGPHSLGEVPRLVEEVAVAIPARVQGGLDRPGDLGVGGAQALHRARPVAPADELIGEGALSVHVHPARGTAQYSPRRTHRGRTGQEGGNHARSTSGKRILA